MPLRFSLFLILSLFSISGSSKESQFQHRSGTIVVQASAEHVWSIVGNFSHPERWLPVIVSTRSSGNSVGSIREVQLKSAAVLREKLEFIDNHQRIIAYSILDPTDPSIMPLRQYRAKISIHRTESGTLVQWETKFRRWSRQSYPPEHLNDEAANRMVQKILDFGLANLKTAAEVDQ